jgi:hypothetical protein
MSQPLLSLTDVSKNFGGADRAERRRQDHDLQPDFGRLPALGRCDKA